MLCLSVVNLGILVLVEFGRKRLMFFLLSCVNVCRLVMWLLSGSWFILKLLVCSMRLVVVWIVIVSVFGIEWLMVMNLSLKGLSFLIWLVFIVSEYGEMWCFLSFVLMSVSVSWELSSGMFWWSFSRYGIVLMWFLWLCVSIILRMLLR